MNSSAYPRQGLARRKLANAGLVLPNDADIITVAGYLDMLDALEQLLGARVDVVSLRKLSPRLREYVERDLVRVA